ncbi:group II intron reverse transcriptase/maturase [Desulfogranum japonicum]|uniref:group II intron reverse transcriptase/maturase n=1 Tax=Desulfogranum japonicum TaxID=231447 RepID=UPI0003F9FA2B|nr:group II intron reverse transcriptase/maturase [Desulfogranum japonicum]
MKKHPGKTSKARQLNLFVDERSLFVKLCDLHNLRAGFKAVKKNGGAPGIDGVTVKEYENCLDKELARLKTDLESWSYKPNPVRRVEIPKPGKGAGVRLLGVPCVRDRVVHATLKILLEPILDPTFSDHSYGFRPGCNQQQAVETAQRIVKSGKEYVVDIDLSKFFDRVNHDRLIYLLSCHIADKRILRLIGIILRSGVMVNGVVQLTEEGTVQGSPLSPLLSNVVLDELDKELERRDLEFCRFADDCNIFVRSMKSANRVVNSISKFIEQKLKLKINRKKSKVGQSREVKFLGMTIIDGTVAISRQSIQLAMQKVKELTPRGTCLSLEQTMKRINEWYMGWSGYYLMTQYPSQFVKIEAHIRRRLRARIVDQQKRRRHLYKKLIKRGVPKDQAAKTAQSNNGRWALSWTKALHKAYPNRWFTDVLGQQLRSNARLKHWFGIYRWVQIA